jgi:hypothetical protein
MPNINLSSLILAPSVFASEDMADPLSVIATVLGLAQVASGAGQGLFNLVSKIRNAPAVLKKISVEVTQFNEILAAVKLLLQTYEDSSLVQSNNGISNVLRTELEGAIEDILQLKNIVEDLSGLQRTRLDFIKIPIKSVLKEKKVLEILSRLIRRKGNLDLELLIIQG